MLVAARFGAEAAGLVSATTAGVTTLMTDS
jgi:hypothetical protein